MTEFKIYENNDDRSNFLILKLIGDGQYLEIKESNGEAVKVNENLLFNVLSKLSKIIKNENPS